MRPEEAKERHDPTLIDVRLTVNGEPVERAVEPRRSLVDFLRHDLGLTGTHVGCEQGVCGMCTVLLDGEPIKSCIMLAVQADGPEITTSRRSTARSCIPLQRAFKEAHGLQCGYCTPAFILTSVALRERGLDIRARSSRRSSPASCAGAPATRTSLYRRRDLPGRR